MLVMTFNKKKCTHLVANLSRREKQVLAGLAAGKMRKEIAADLEISIHTVSVYTRNVYRMLNVRGSVLATRVAISAKLV